MVFYVKNIYDLKAEFDELEKSECPKHARLEQSWEYFKESLSVPLDEDYVDEFGASLGIVTQYTDRKLYGDVDLFGCNFSRLIDSRRHANWRTAEIEFGFYFTITPELRDFAKRFPRYNIEAFCEKTEEIPADEEKIQTVIAFMELQTEVWDILRNMDPVKVTNFFHIEKKDDRVPKVRLLSP